MGKHLFLGWTVVLEKRMHQLRIGVNHSRRHKGLFRKRNRSDLLQAEQELSAYIDTSCVKSLHERHRLIPIFESTSSNDICHRLITGVDTDIFRDNHNERLRENKIEKLLRKLGELLLSALRKILPGFHSSASAQIHQETLYP